MTEIQIGIVVKNPSKIISFYTRTFGFELLFDDPSGYAEIQIMDNVKIAIEPIEVVHNELGLIDTFKQFLRIKVIDMEKTINECKKYGGQLLKSPITQPYGKIEAYVLDPENNVIQLYQNI